MPIIHLGYPKTGTTWLQDMFFKHVSNFQYVKKNVCNDIFVKPNAFSFDKQLAIEEISLLTQNKDIILSSELFAGTTNRGWLRGFWSKEIARRLHSVLPKAEIVIFIRRQEDLIASAYMQYIKNGGNFSINRYLESSAYNLFSFDHLNFYKLVQFYETLYGKESLQIFLFEDFKNDSINFMKDFSARLGFQVDFSSIDFTPINESLPIKLLALKKFGNLFYYRMYPYKHYFFPIRGWNNYQEKVFASFSKSKLFSGKAKSKDILGEKWISYIKDYYKESNKALFEEYKLEGLEKYNYSL
ncbi:MAG: hypothetical protein PHD00_03475 [Bacteroidales bacterium]|nr:hypothetical protein [Bacteroidales bacterium]MDD4671380.1 hypothetical protein [Bacteroidales bacterium]MDY0347695.1 hypothetical protein [Tenuifilaceae bacterium]